MNFNYLTSFVIQYSYIIYVYIYFLILLSKFSTLNVKTSITRWYSENFTAELHVLF